MPQKINRQVFAWRNIILPVWGALGCPTAPIEEVNKPAPGPDIDDSPYLCRGN